MQCPFCGSEGIAEDVVFCPHCRYQFRQPDAEPVRDPLPQYIHGGRQIIVEDEDEIPAHEIRFVSALILQPAVLVMIFITAILYLVIGSLPVFTLASSLGEIRIGALVSLAAGAVIAWIFYRLVLFRME